MTGVNDHIVKYLDYYLDSKTIPGFAVMLNGVWGSGKTWFIKHYLKERFEEKKGYLYVSLYGVQSVSQIEEQFFQQLHPVKSSKGFKIASSVLKGTLKAGFKIDLDFNDDNKGDGSINSNISIPDKELPEGIDGTKGYLLVFDDLERSGMVLSQLLGYINHFVEHQDFKVILIGDESRISNEDERKKDAGNEESDKKALNGDNVQYQKIKEKLIGKTFTVKTELDSAIGSFINDLTNNALTDYLNKNRTLINGIYTTAQYHNLRHLKQSLWDFERFSSEIEDHFKKNERLYDSLFTLFLVLSIELKSGSIKYDDIKRLNIFTLRKALRANNEDMNVNYDFVENISKTEAMTLFDHYNQFLKTDDYVLPLQYWLTVFEDGYIDKEKLNRHLADHPLENPVEQPIWARLWRFHDIEDQQELDQLILTLDKLWKNKEFKKPGEILHIAGIKLRFSEWNLITKSKKEVLADCVSYIDNLESLDFSIEQFGTFGKVIEDSWGGFGFIECESEEFQKIRERVEAKIESSFVQILPEYGNEILEVMQNDMGALYRIMTGVDSYKISLLHLPILAHIDFPTFISVFKTLPNEEKSKFITILKERYSPRLTELKEEITFLNKLKSWFEDFINENSKSNKIQCVNIKKYLMPRLDTAIQKLNDEV